MVDLVKLRKKAKKQSAEQSAQGTVHSAQSTESPTPQPRDAETPKPTPDKLSRFMQEAGKLRESVEEEAQVEQAADTSQLELLTFIIAGEQYALDIERIVEIVRPRPITRVPNVVSSSASTWGGSDDDDERMKRSGLAAMVSRLWPARARMV